MDLGRLLIDLSQRDNPDLLVGFDTADDAGVYRVGENLALVQTVDLITPVCDDAHLFGRIAAANALSDVYAMGGRPLTALNICCFPGEGVPTAVYAEILFGARRALDEAGAALLGGHTVRDKELKYGLAVTGLIDPDRILRNGGARPGDVLILTKPIGTGVLINAARKDLVADEELHPVLETMARLNAAASEAALRHGAHACTDITGFGLAGHALEMARASRRGLRFRSRDIPIHPASPGLVERGVTTAMTGENRAQAGDAIRFAPAVDAVRRELFFDPQTSGGLLIALSPDRAGALVAELQGAGSPEAAVVGEILASTEPVIEVE